MHLDLRSWTARPHTPFVKRAAPRLEFPVIRRFLLPLAMLEWYYRVSKNRAVLESFAFVGVLVLLTLYMTLGIFAATMGMWIPRMA